MRISDPKTALLVPVAFELNWSSGMPADEQDVKIIGWERSTDSIMELSGRLKGTLVKRTPDKDDLEWLKLIGARA